MIGISRKSHSSAKSTISSKCCSINCLSYPRTAPFKKIFSLAVRSPSNPAPSSINGAIEPLIRTFPLYGFKIPQISFSNVDFPDPFVPMIPQASPFFTSKLTSFNAKNSLNISSLRTSFTKYSLRLSIRSEAILKRTTACSTRTAYSLFIILSSFN